MLRLFAPELAVAAIAPKLVCSRTGWFKPGGLSLTVLDILRVAPSPLSVREVAAR